jgi:hypothetical protein
MINKTAPRSGRAVSKGLGWNQLKNDVNVTLFIVFGDQRPIEIGGSKLLDGCLAFFLCSCIQDQHRVVTAQLPGASQYLTAALCKGILTIGSKLPPERIVYGGWVGTSSEAYLACTPGFGNQLSSRRFGIRAFAALGKYQQGYKKQRRKKRFHKQISGID